MALLKCKMCGGDINPLENSTVCVCEYCGTKQTVPSLDNEKKIALFARANRLRLGSEFDKAYSIYETIIIDYPEEAEAYWGLVLCKYGIEYVDDPKTAKKVPTCHRSSFESIFDDPNYDLTIEYSSLASRTVYREEAKAIEEIRKGIIEISSKEDPYDIFICYKETDENGERTIDSVIAEDVYDALTAKGYRVFFSRITLEDKLGVEYEPYIFSALHSAKIMLAFGTDYEYYNAVWVKNEWSRFLKLIEKDKKKVLIPCYKGIDAYDMPREFAKLQAQDMGKVGAMQDLLRGIEKILPLKKQKEVIKETVVVSQQSPTADFFAPILNTAKEQLQKKDFASAKQTYQKVLDFMPNNDEALHGLLLVAMKKTSLENGIDNFTLYKEYENLYLVASEEFKAQLKDACEKVKYNNATALKSKLEEKDFKKAKYYADNLATFDALSDEEMILIFLLECSVSSIEELSSAKEPIENAPSYNKCIELTSSKEIILKAKEEQEKRFEAEEKHRKEAKAKALKRTGIAIASVLSAIILAILLVCASIGIGSYAYFKSDYYIYGAKFENGNAIITTYRGNEEEIVIPEEIAGKPVTSIGQSAFYDCTNLKSITIPDSVTSIGLSAFSGCRSLESITIPKSVTYIGSSAFHGCKRIQSATMPTIAIDYIPQDSLKTVVINGGESIEDSAFEDCISLTSITIPEGVTSIGDYAFRNCTSLTSIIIPESVTNIGNYAFRECTSLKSVIITENVTNIGSFAFYYCENLESIIIPNSVRIIGEYAFGSCTKITIYCKSWGRLIGWDSEWNSSNRPVVWGYTGE